MDFISLINFSGKTFQRNPNVLKANQSLHEAIEPENKAWKLEINEVALNEEKVLHYFNTLFSPKLFTQSLIKHNQNLQIKCLQNSDSEPEELYQRRAKKVKNLQQKENKNLSILQEMRKKDLSKFQALAKFMNLFGNIKQKIGNLRHDYYSQKSFETLKKLSSEQLNQLTKVLSQILNSVMNMNIKLSRPSKGVDLRFIQFLIIPRFFVSKEKILKLISNQNIQESFKMLIFYGCLGHYNNQANKKLPQESQMKYFRILIQEEDGRERFKKICTINHGGKFFKRHPDLYFKLYTKSFEALKKIDQKCKGKYSDDQIMLLIDKEQIVLDKKNEEKSVSQDDKSSQKQPHYFLPIPKQNSFHCKKSPFPLPKQFCDIESVSNMLSTFSKQDMEDLKRSTSILTQQAPQCQIMQGTKTKVRRFQSLIPVTEHQGSKSRLKKAYTVEMGRQPNIILVTPPNKDYGSLS